MLNRLKSLAGIIFAGCGIASLGFGADAAPTLSPGANRDEVFQVYGWPTGQSRSGTREVLNYPQGLVTLESGRVERVDFSTKFSWPAPRPRPPAPSPVSTKVRNTLVDPWLDDFEVAARAATERGRPVLALFVNRDGSAGSRQFQEQVSLHPEFVGALGAEVVFLRLDFGAPAERLREQNDRLREKLGVVDFPALLLTSPDGQVLFRADLSASLVGGAFRARLIRTLKAECARLARLGTATARETTTVLPPEVARVQLALAEGLGLSATAALNLGVALAAAVVLGFLAWLLWRTRTPRELPPGALVVRLSDNEGGVPTPGEMASWSKERLCAVTAALAESEGYVAEIMPLGSDKDVVLKRRGQPQPQVVVLCAAGDKGVVTAKRLRELRGTLTAEGAQTGWFVAPRGFAMDAMSYAAEHHLRLIDAPRLVESLRQLPPLLLPKLPLPVALRQAA